jgi:transcriptional regulator with XRE-family HTH domain
LTDVGPIHVAFGKAIRELRLERQMSQEALALEADINRSYASGVERGVRNISLTNIAKLAAALNIEVSDLFVRVQEIRQR